MKGAVIYNREDYIKNSDFVKWLIEEFDLKNVTLDLYFGDDFYNYRRFEGNYNFIINRTRDFNLSQLFEINGIRVFNNSQITLLGNNKYAAYLFAKQHNFKIPKIFISPNANSEIICKENAGHGGRNIHLLSNNNFDENYIYQEFIKDLQGDIRFYIINNKIYKAVKRYSKNNYIFNYSQGGDCTEYKYSNEEYDYVNNMLSFLKVDYAGFDFFLTKDGELIFNEIEDVVGSRMLSKLGDNKTVPIFVEHIMKSI